MEQTLIFASMDTAGNTSTEEVYPLCAINKQISLLFCFRARLRRAHQLEPESLEPSIIHTTHKLYKYCLYFLSRIPHRSNIPQFQLFY